MEENLRANEQSLVAAVRSQAGATSGAESQVKRGVILGFVSGLAAITCCVSPVALALLGVATAAEAVTLGDTLYYEFGWWFRGAGLLIAVAAVYIHLRRRGSCSLRGVKSYKRLIGIMLAVGVVTYVGLFWFTKYLGIWFG
jgi:hypothetical protein